jgi:EAL domain-containing protein (putative c-di-GMP-specific phosphodiesterase class I)/ABC-type amino acid transport substrate-binding protein
MQKIGLYLIAAMMLISGIFSNGSFAQTGSDHQTKIVFAGSADYPPFEWLDTKGRAKGFVIDLQECMGRHGGRAVEHRLGNWPDAVSAAENGDADVIAFLGSKERSRHFDFTLPFYHLSHAVFSHARGRQFRSLEDLKGYRAAVVSGSYAESRLQKEQTGITFFPVNSERACVEAVHTGLADACIEVALTTLRNAEDLDVVQTSHSFWHQPYVFGVRKGNTELLAWMNLQLAAMQADGTFFSIYQRWKKDLEWQPQTLADHLRTVAWILIPLALAGLAGFSLSWYLKCQVANRTRQLRHMAEYDGMTGLHSRQAFAGRLEQHLVQKSGRPPVVVFLRLKNLESITSLFGRSGYEKMVRDFAHRLQHLDFLETTHSGIGYFILAARSGTAPARIYDFLKMSCKIDAVDVTPEVVMGVSAGPVAMEASGPNAEEYIRQAITAYSSAVRENLSWRIYAPQLEPDPDDLILLHDLHLHGTRDMHLVYQPKLDLVSGHIREAEALIRWHHPKMGMISPGKFIPMLEKSGLIRQVTRWVIKEAVQELIRCREYNARFRISVNIAANDLADEALVDFIKDRLDPEIRKGLCFEVTETGIIHNADHAREVISDLHDAGVRWAVDDFGTGHSCLTYLSRFDIDEVKLDRSFVKNILTSPRDRDIVAGMIYLSHNLGLTVTAEGMEDEATLNALAKMGCDTAQGYVIARPMPAKDIYPFINRKLEK